MAEVQGEGRELTVKVKDANAPSIDRLWLTGWLIEWLAEWLIG
mgnify:CR=1 FL=1